MIEGTRYVWDRPPTPEELRPDDNYTKEFDKWVLFKANVEMFASAVGLDPSEAIERSDIYQMALDYTDADEGGMAAVEM